MEKITIYDPRILKNIYLTLITNSDITSAIPQLTQIIDEFGELIPNLDSNKYSLINGTGEFNVQALTDNFYYLLEKILIALNEYGAMIENSELLAFTSVEKECPLTSDQTNFMKKVKMAFTYANQFLFALERFGIRKHHLVEFEMEINNCEKYNLLNENEVKERIYSLLFRIDHLIELLKDRYPRFYNEYKMSKLTPVQDISYENISVW